MPDYKREIVLRTNDSFREGHVGVETKHNKFQSSVEWFSEEELLDLQKLINSHIEENK